MMTDFSVFIALTISLLHGCLSSEIEDAYIEHEIIPEIMRVSPKKILQVIYEKGAIVDLGTELTPTQVRNKPNVTWEAEEGAFYTLAMLDPDTPSRLLGRQYFEVRHWIVMNIPGNSVPDGEVINDYVGAAPLRFTGYHRILLLVYKQPNGFIKIKNRRRGSPRFQTTPFKFVQKFNLGDPEFGNFYQVKHDALSKVLLEELVGFRI